MITDSRLRNDIKALKLATKTYTHHAWELCKQMGIDGIIKSASTLKEIANKTKIKNIPMLEAMLDFLVGRNVLGWNNNSYFLKNAPKNLTSYERAFVEKHYGGSIKWSEFMYERAAEVLRNGKAHDIAGFNSPKVVELWDSVMQGPFYSLRRIAIRKLLKGLPNGARVADLGCGSGGEIIEMLSLSNKVLHITGFDNSNAMLQKAKTAVKNFEAKNSIQSQNAAAVQFIQYNITEDFTNLNKFNKFDGVFASLVLHHLENQEREILLNRIKNILKPYGRLILFQLVNESKFQRIFSDWLMFVVPSHRGFPFRKDYLDMLNHNFSNVKSILSNLITEASN